MLNLLSNTIKSYSSTGSSLIKQIQEENTRTEYFFKEIQNWKNAESNYINKIGQITNSLRDRGFKALMSNQQSMDTGSGKIQLSEPTFSANLEFAKILQIVMDNHKSFLSKINYDVFLVNFEASDKILSQSKKLLDEEKQQQKQITSKKDLLQKILTKRQKLKKQKQQEEMLQIFSMDSVVETTIDQKIRKKNKIKEIQKQSEEFQMKVKQTLEEYRKLYEKNKQNFNKIKHNCKQQSKCKVEALLKLQLHLNTYWKNLASNIDEYEANSKYLHGQKSIDNINQHIFARIERRQDEVFKRLELDKGGFIQNSLKLITQSTIQELLEYSKDKEVKGKIKRMMQSNDVNPAETDEASRQVKLIKKMLSQQSVQAKCLEIFKGIINKSSKLRMNFVFILQFFRINNQFEISLNQIHPLHCLISQFLQSVHFSCYFHRDSFVLKQVMILLMTYYVNHPKQTNQVQKIYIIHFFKKNPLWRDFQYWQSILVECIYLEKKNTNKMMIISESGNLTRKKQLMQAQRLAILNQMLMVVRNMVIFQFTEKQVKNFASRFIKLLKQDEKFQKDIFSTIEDAVKQESKLQEEQKSSIKEFYISNLIKQKSEEYQIPTSVRKSYTS